VARNRTNTVAATAQLEGWRLPVAAALQPVLVVDAAQQLVAASPAATRLLLLPALGRPLTEAVGLQDLAEEWDASPFVTAVTSGATQRARLPLPSAGVEVDVVALPLFGQAGVIGALVFLTTAL
jgi:hypothetical protein